MNAANALAYPIGRPIPSLFGLEARNAQAEKVITDYACGHAAADVAAGIAGLLVPGGSIIALIGSIAAQAPLVYVPMTEKLAQIYSTRTDSVSNNIIFQSAMGGAGLDAAATFGAEFLTEIAGELLHEVGIGIGLSFLPVIGALTGALLDAAIAVTLTWRVGTTVAMYFQNGEQWLGDRKSTYHAASHMVGRISAKAENRVRLDDVSADTPEIRTRMIGFVAMQVETLMAADATQDMIRRALSKKGVPQWLIAEGLRMAAGAAGC
jgi:uncharacterized protein (DUF697 family)